MATRQETNARREDLRASLRLASRRHSGDPIPAPPVRRLAVLHQLSTPSVCEVLQELREEGVLQTVPRLGTFLVSSAPKTRAVIGLSLDFFYAQGESYWGTLLHGISEGAKAANADILFMSPDSKPAWERASGIIVSGNSGDDLGSAPDGFPVVSVMLPRDGADCVRVDDYDGARQITARLLALGHRRIAAMYIGQPACSTLRLQGYQDAMKAAGIEPLPAWAPFNEDFSGNSPMYMELGYHRTQQWLATTWRSLGCTALVTYNDATAAGAIRAFRDAGLDVPNDVSVAGFDNSADFAVFEPQLTTVDVPLVEIGKSAVNLLIRKINGEETSEKPPLKAWLVKGASSQALRASYD